MTSAAAGEGLSTAASIRLQFITAVSSSVIVFVNVMLTTVAKKLNKYQRFHTRTSYEAGGPSHHLTLF